MTSKKATKKPATKRKRTFKPVPRPHQLWVGFYKEGPVAGHPSGDISSHRKALKDLLKPDSNVDVVGPYVLAERVSHR